MLDYGIIGNCITCALIKKNASVDWMCFPTFSSPSIFAKLLDNKKGGSFEIKPLGKYKVVQKYLASTAILETIFTSENDSFGVYDFFPRYKKLIKNRDLLLNCLIRVIKPIKGKSIIKVVYSPMPNYAEESPMYIEKEGSLLSKSKEQNISLVSNIEYNIILGSKPFLLDHTKYFILGDEKINANEFNVKRCNKLLAATRQYWEKWSGSLITPEKNRDMIIRSAITLKLLTYHKSGAIIAAPTTSIPEEIGTERTWDYRYCWVRDATFCADIFKKLGRNYEPKKLMEFVINTELGENHIQPMYGINGKIELIEGKLEHLDGFKGSKPVRIGNAAYKQSQNDIFGEFLDIMYLYFVYYEYEKKMSKKYWRFVQKLVRQIELRWDKEDSGIWEFRGQTRHYVFSKFMCFVGVDRAIKIAQHYGRSDFVNKCLNLKEKIREDILKNGYNQELNSFTISYGSNDLDASLLQMGYYEFLDNTDPRMIGTVKAIYNNLRRDYLVQRYSIKDDFGKSKSAFTICSFWLVDALFSIGEIEKAREIYDKLIKRANHLGLFSEDIDIKTKKLIGNFPQAYTHIALINSSILLSEWSAKRKKFDWVVIPRRKTWF